MRLRLLLPLLPLAACDPGVGKEQPPAELVTETVSCPDGRRVVEPVAREAACGLALWPSLWVGGGFSVGPSRPSGLIQGELDPAARWWWEGSHLHGCTPALHVQVDESCTVKAWDSAGLVVDAVASASTWTLALPEDVRIRGVGERTGPEERFGGSYTFRNTDAFKAECQGWCPQDDPLYLSLPTFLLFSSGRTTGWILDSPVTQQWELGNPAVLQAEGELPILTWLPGPTPSDVARQRHALWGAPARWPRWAFGWQQSRWGWPTDEAVAAIAAGYQSRGWPLSGIWLDIQAMDGFRSFTWDPVAFDGIRPLLAVLEADGIRAVAIVDPGLKQDEGWDIWQEAVAGGHLLGGAEPYIGEVWPGRAGFPDFSRPETREWWGALIEKPLADGVDGLWIDMNEPSDFSGPGGTVPDSLPVDGNGTPATMAWAHNLYGSFEAEATYEGLLAAAPDKRPFVLSRAGYLGLHRHAGVWTGDAPSTWATLQTTVPMLLGLSVSGIPYVGSDVGGYCCEVGDELYARWLQVGLLSPFFRGHAASNARDQEPWAFGEEVQGIAGEIFHLRSALLPTFESLADVAVTDGQPMLRPIWWDRPDQPEAWYDQDLLMLGPWLLAAPVLSEGASSRSFTLPSGRWMDLASSAIWEGPTELSFPTPLGALPLLLAEGAILPRADSFDPAEAPLRPDDAGLASLDLFPSSTPSSLPLVDDGGEGWAMSRRVLHLHGSATGATVRVEAADPARVDAWTGRSLELRIRPVDRAPTEVRLDGAALPLLPAPGAFDTNRPAAPGWWWDPGARALRVRLPDQNGWLLEADYDATLQDSLVPMPFELRLPEGTPLDETVTIATDVTGWVHHPMTRVSDTQARILLDVPRGTWIYYKYARGGWETVEKWPGCVEAENRYEQSRPGPVKQDVVWGWADGC